MRVLTVHGNSFIVYIVSGRTHVFRLPCRTNEMC